MARAESQTIAAAETATMRGVADRSLLMNPLDRALGLGRATGETTSRLAACP